MIGIQLIASGYNSNNERVILWRLGNYYYSLEIAGKDHKFEAAYEQALWQFNCEVTDPVEIA